jgi:hypothetical protein
MWLLIALMLSFGALAAPPPTAPPSPTASQPPDPRVEARAKIRTLVGDIQHIERIRAKTPANALDGSCVDEKLAEARAGLQIAAAELARLEDGQARGDATENDYAAQRLRLLVERSGELAHAARVCATEELSTIDTTKVEVEISPSVPAGDPTRPPGEWEPPQRPPQQ